MDGWKRLALQGVRAGEICPACLGLEWVRTDEPFGHPQFGRLERCPTCSKGELSAYLRRSSGLTGWQAEATFARYKTSGGERAAQLEHARALYSRGYGWLTLWGGYGTGKTYLLAALVNECLAASRPAVYISAGKLLDHLRDAYAPDGIGYSEAFTHWSRCQVLAIDEADQFHRTDWAADKYRQLLDYRYNLACSKETVTAFACNADPNGKEWPRELGWLWSRMRQFPIIEAAGGDVRPILGDGYKPWEDKF